MPLKLREHLARGCISLIISLGAGCFANPVPNPSTFDAGKPPIRIDDARVEELECGEYLVTFRIHNQFHERLLLPHNGFTLEKVGFGAPGQETFYSIAGTAQSDARESICAYETESIVLPAGQSIHISGRAEGAEQRCSSYESVHIEMSVTLCSAEGRAPIHERAYEFELPIGAGRNAPPSD